MNTHSASTESPPYRSSRLLAIVVLVALGGWLFRHASREPLLPERSVHPGINDSYDDPDVPRWLGRFETESREIYAHRNEIVAACRVRPGQVVADIGAGTGLFTLLFAEAVGPTGRVIAVDIVPAFLDLIRRRAVEHSLTNVETVRCSETSIRLPAHSIDAAFICDVYHHFEFPRNTLTSIHRALRPGGVLIVVDFIRIEGRSRDWILEHVRAGRETVIEEITGAGFELLDGPETPYLQENYLLRFQKAS